MSTAPNAERGIAPQRVEFARENYLGDGEFGVTPSDPEFKKYSDNVRNVNITPEVVLERRGGLGSADPKSFERGPESHEVVVTYDLIKWLGDPTGDAAYDGIERQGDELLPNSHSFLMREDKSFVRAGATVAGNTARPTRLYLYGRGGLVDEGTINGNPSEQQPITVELTYRFQYLRAQQIDQPTDDEGASFLFLRSTDAGDTSVSVEVEGVDGTGADASETVSLDGSDATTAVSTSTEFESVDAFYVEEDNAGDVVLGVNTGDDSAVTEGDELARVFGANTYDDVESDYGVPPLGNGSREAVADLGTPENFIGDTVQSNDSDYPNVIQGISLTFANNVETTEVANQYGMAMHPGNREVAWETTEFGERASIDSVQAHAQNEARDQSWDMSGGTITLEQSRLVEPGEVAKEEEQAIMTIENRWVGEGISFS